MNLWWAGREVEGTLALRLHAAVREVNHRRVASEGKEAKNEVTFLCQGRQPSQLEGLSVLVHLDETPLNGLPAVLSRLKDRNTLPCSAITSPTVLVSLFGKGFFSVIVTHHTDVCRELHTIYQTNFEQL